MHDQRQLVLDPPNSDYPPSDLQIEQRTLPYSQSILEENGPTVTEAPSGQQAAMPDVAALAPLAALISQGDYTQAETAARSLTKQLPQNPLVWQILATLLAQRKQVSDAAFCYRRLIELQPEVAGHHIALGTLLLQQKSAHEAEASYRRAIALNPSSTEAYSLLSSLLINRQRFSDAESVCLRSLELNPRSAATEKKLGYILHQTCRNTEAAQAYRRALAIDPKDHEIHSLLLMCLSHDASVGPEELFTQHSEYGKRVEAPHRSNWPQHPNLPDPERRLNVGFVSADFRDHAVSYFLEPVLTQLAKDPSFHASFALHAFAQTVREDAVTQKLRRYFDHWTPIEHLSDEDLSSKILSNEIEILIDLSGHTPGNRLAAFARKPAPIQVSWIGYPGTTGLYAMDYSLGDRFFLPRELFAPQFTEKIVHLPAAGAYQPPANAPAVNPLPAFQNGHITFGSFNRPAKLSPPVISLWSGLLRALPRAHMLLAAMPADGSFPALFDWFDHEGIARERLRLHPRSDMQTYLALHHQVDLCLDAFPYAGATTTYHALWMGVPTLTLAGNTPAGRDGVTALNHIGLESFIAEGQEEFVQRGIHWARNLSHLAEVRSTLRERFAHSPFANHAVLAEALAVALRTMWKRWCAQLPPEAF